jgi:hypothetical protein
MGGTSKSLTGRRPQGAFVHREISGGKTAKDNFFDRGGLTQGVAHGVNGDSCAQSYTSSGPAARWIAPSTPPAPSSEELAALTMASVASRVMSHCIARRIAGIPVGLSFLVCS